MTLSTASQRPDAVVDTPLSPRVVLLWRAPWIILTAVLLIPALAVAVGATDIPLALRLLVPVVVLAIGIGCAVLVPNATYRRWRYAVTDDGVELRHGLLVRHESSIPHFRVQHIDIEHGPIERWRGLVKLTISTASPASDAVLPGIEPDRAEQLRARILARAEADDGV
ncbi:MAG: rane-flanked domain protein [Acidimicrobiales bacterium]|nr:rane-flanked domain protein [Acidimicrobiales bacterium]